ncbi:MAG: metallophosphoesterase [Kiritimatiellae bacterium]|nr:metallophosphoesterase [Kiritimatiellia bacterium]
MEATRRGFITGAVVLAGAAASRPLGAAEAAKPLLRLAVMSDLQGYAYPEDAGMRNLEHALDVLAGFRPDVVVNDGDICDTGCDLDAVAYYKARCDARLGAVPHVACMGNHEIGFIPDELKDVRTPAVCRREFNAVFGYDPDARVVRRTIGGYDFVALSLSDVDGYTADEIDELKAALDAAVARDPKKSVFVVTHYHPANTVNNSGSWWLGGRLRQLLDGYPQVVSISGHTHCPLQDPRSIWQGTFTAVETSTLCYGCIDSLSPAANQVSSLLPYGHESVGFMLVEVFADRLTFRRFSARDRREIEPGEPWTVRVPYRPADAVYSFESRRAREVAPQFDGDVEPTLWYDFGYVYLMFEAATKGGPVYGYRIDLTAKGGGASSHLHLADFYRLPAHRQRRIVFRAPPFALSPGRRYHCRITPVGFFGATGRGVEWTFAVKPGYPCRSDPPQFVQE